ncbi:MAG: MBL fold metallo-hydrolase [Desulfomonilaceae bacterium]|nr:MBL fold metallo-hydrolase [Desulfomonilaceae bacterium]
MGEPNLEIIRPGDKSGNDMIVKIALPSGRDLLAYATKNQYSEEWDLGPTWNYLVLGDRPFLVDTGGRSQGKNLLAMMAHTGRTVHDLDFILLSHGHEDHDGGLAEIVGSAGGNMIVKAHAVYERLIRIYPSQTPDGTHQGFPASCRHCPMPESFSRKWCREYHQERSELAIDCFNGSAASPDSGIEVFHTPGHSPDAVAVLVDREAMLVGDSVLPDITPHPTRESFFELTKDVLPAEYVEAQQLYGLRAYIRSLNVLRRISESPANLVVLPAHRLYYNGTWNHLDPATRIDELIGHHITRCADILDIIRHEPRTTEEISRAYFEPNLLKGVGINMANNEVASHCELLRISGDAVFVDEERVVATGIEGRFEALIRDLGEGGDQVYS